ncbi:2Fe-2S iron-sulfur cluster-binding protein [Paenibacillus durus]|uniref:Ferredoxin n=1 Tax=Paenibacillus durus ATCC 35681 TaxID=1333534 RepID=A0A0F7FAW6_PAEDU|nr:2Fe-2S iron-sulfur cluster-binding protein [Paenibacillus durus]AKG35425.1 ferredoxin [Paenibacillus durus ATCC 35681]
MKTHRGYKVVFLPEGRQTEIAGGASLLTAARKAGVKIASRCDGKAGCLMCKVKVEDETAGGVKPPGDIERRKLGSQLSDGVRLACQAIVQGDIRVTIPEDPLKAAVRRRLEEARRGREDELW